MKCFRFNNTKIANSIRRNRDLPGYRLSVTVSRRGAPKPIHAYFVLTQDLGYWDMAVADAIYSLLQEGKRHFTPRAVLAAAAADPGITVPAGRRQQISSSIDRLIHTEIFISCHEERETSPELQPRYGGAFLRAAADGKGYRFLDDAPMPLYAYAEAKRQLITVPAAVMGCTKQQPDCRLVNNNATILLRHFLIHELELVRNPNNRLAERVFYFRGKQSESLWVALEVDIASMSAESRSNLSREMFRKSITLMEGWTEAGYLLSFTADPKECTIRVGQGMICADPFSLPLNS